MTDTPSARIVADARKTTELTTPAGRRVKIRNLTVLDQTRLYRAMGADHSLNQPYSWVVMAGAAVYEIDGVPCPMPRDERGIDSMLERLGDDVINTVLVHQRMEMESKVEEARKALEGEGKLAAGPLA
jgi:hypothetical protein